jgi:Icc-related predicted phosphoesterase
MKLWHFSDTHELENQLKVPDGIDIAIFSGDCANSKISALNSNKMEDFLEWYAKLDIKYKIFVAGNHDVALERGLIKKENFDQMGITILHDSMVTVENLKIWGSPYTPTYGVDWAYNESKQKIKRHWDLIPDGVDIIVTHGPPKGKLDLSTSKNGLLEQCGDSALNKAILRINPALHCFGHIHNSDDITNAGTMTINNIIYSNGSVVTDRKMDVISSNGNIFKF